MSAVSSLISLLQCRHRLKETEIQLLLSCSARSTSRRKGRQNCQVTGSLQNTVESNCFLFLVSALIGPGFNAVHLHLPSSQFNLATLENHIIKHNGQNPFDNYLGFYQNLFLLLNQYFKYQCVLDH